MEFKLNETQESIQNLARDFAEKVLSPRIDDIEEVGHFPTDIYQQMADTGLLGIAFDEKYGGIGAGYDSFVLAFEELSKVSPSAATALLITLLPLEAINLFGSEEQKQAYIGPSIEGKLRGSMAFTEPSTGSDPKQLTTTARLDGDTWVISGVKRFISNAAYAGPMLLYAKEAETGKCTAFLFDKPIEGYSTSTPWEKVGLLGSPCYDVFLDEVRVPNDDFHILGKRGDGFTILKATTAYGKLGFSAVFLGAFGGAVNAAKDYVTTKVHRDSTITKFQAIQMKFATMLSKYESCRYMVYNCAETANDHSRLEEMLGQSALVKAYVGDTAVEGCVLAMNLMGSYGVMKEYQAERFLRDALIGPHVEGQTDVQRVIAAGYYLNH